MCSSRKYPIAHPKEGWGNSKGGGGGSKAQFFEQKYDTKREFPEGGGEGSI